MTWYEDTQGVEHLEGTLTFAPSAARTTTASGSDIDSGSYEYAEIVLDVSAVSGTNPTLNVVIEEKDGTGAYRTIATFAQVTAAATGASALGLAVPLVGRAQRARWTIGGTATPTFTFSVIGTAR